MRNILILSLTLFACGGAIDASVSADDLSTREPLHLLPMAAQAAATYAANPQLLHAEGKAAGTGYTWSFLFRGDFGQWATVACDGKTATIVETHHMVEPPIGMSVVDTGNVKVGLRRLTNIATNAGCDALETIELDQPLAAGAHPLWIATSAAHQVTVDAETGKLLQ
jgi:hypothetical protein